MILYYLESLMLMQRLIKTTDLIKIIHIIEENKKYANTSMKC